MNAATISSWATRNDFHALGPLSFHKYDNDRKLSLEIKRASIVIILETAGAQPRIIARLFKDLRYDPIQDSIHGMNFAAV